MFKREITKAMEENGFHLDGESGMRTFKRVRGSDTDEISIGWWANEKVAKADRAYSSHLFIQIPSGRFRLPFTEFILDKDGNMSESKRDWDDLKDELVNVFIGSFTSPQQWGEILSNPRYIIKAKAPELP